MNSQWKPTRRFRKGALRSIAYCIKTEHSMCKRFLARHGPPCSPFAWIIKKSHYQLIEARKNQIRHFFQILRDKGFFRKDLSNEHYEFLITQCFAFGDFWISSSEILYKGPASKKVEYYVEGYLALFSPYLTEKGKQWALGSQSA